MPLIHPPCRPLVKVTVEICTRFGVCPPDQLILVDMDFLEKGYATGFCIRSHQLLIHRLGILYVYTLILVIRRDKHRVPPTTFRRTVGITDNFVNSRFRLAGRCRRHTPHGDRKFVGAHIGPRIILEEAEHIVGSVGIVIVKPPVGKPCRNHRITSERLHLRSNQTRVVGGTAEKQRITEFLTFACIPPVIKHFQHLAYPLHVGNTARKLVIHLLGGYNQNIERFHLVTTVEIGQPVGLAPPFRRGDNHHFGHRLGMEILVAYGLYICRLRKRPGRLPCSIAALHSRIRGCPCGFATCNGHIHARHLQRVGDIPHPRR